jgi:hypothetical protein
MRPSRWFAVAVVLAVGSACAVAWDVVRAPSSSFLCNFVHPDCLGNHWLMVWVAEQLSAGRGILRNDAYYWPFGDAPWLAGNGSEGIAYLPLHLLLGWPLASNVHLVGLLALNGLAAYALARASGASGPAAASVVPAGSILVYAVHEMGAGRFSQVSLCWLGFFLAAWIGLLRAPSTARALGAAALLAVTSLFYWYYGFFGVMAGAVLLAVLPRSRAQARPLALFAVAYLALIGPLLWLFLSNWQAIPGTAEDVFPHPETEGDSAWPAVPFLAAAGRHAGRVLPFTVCALACVALFDRERRRVVAGLVAVAALFGALMAGTLWEGGPYERIYALAGPLRRFWWPYRHVAVLNLAVLALAGLGADALLARFKREWVATVVVLALGLSVPLQLSAQGAPWRAQFGRTEWPEPFYAALADRPGTIVIEPPFAPEVANAQSGLMYQLLHRKQLIGGHALWVARVRPAGWDDFVAKNTFLSALQRLERAELTEGRLRFESADLRALIDAGAHTAVVNREYFPLAMRELVEAYLEVFGALFGPPIARNKRAAAFDTTRWTGATDVEVDVLTWPARVRPGGPVLPIQAPRGPSLAFSVPAEAPPPPGGSSAKGRGGAHHPPGP